MSRVCQLCAKKEVVGRVSRHHRGVAGRQWMKRAQKTAKSLKANLHPKTINGVRMILCTKCIKRIKKEQELALEEVAAAKTQAAA